MTPEELQERTLVFAVEAYGFIKPLFRDFDTRYVAEQLARCTGSVAMNYRAACLARSHREWTAKIGIVREEADESLGWLIFIDRTGMASASREAGQILLAEARQLARIFGASFRTSQFREHAKRP
jgi:four helix bundle protein